MTCNETSHINLASIKLSLKLYSNNIDHATNFVTLKVLGLGETEKDALMIQEQPNEVLYIATAFSTLTNSKMKRQLTVESSVSTFYDSLLFVHDRFSLKMCEKRSSSC